MFEVSIKARGIVEEGEKYSADDLRNLHDAEQIFGDYHRLIQKALGVIEANIKLKSLKKKKP